MDPRKRRPECKDVLVFFVHHSALTLDSQHDGSMAIEGSVGTGQVQEMGIIHSLRAPEDAGLT